MEDKLTSLFKTIKVWARAIKQIKNLMIAYIAFKKKE